MSGQSGFSQIAIIILVLVVAAAGVGFFIGKKGESQPVYQQDQYSQKQVQQDHGTKSDGQSYGYRSPFYEKDGLSFQQYWPRDFYAPSMKADETEILVINESGKTVQFKKIVVEYFVDGVKTSDKSGTWEKFPLRESWDRSQYVNISPAHYKGEPLILNPGEKGKIHHHIEASKDIPSSKD